MKNLNKIIIFTGILIIHLILVLFIKSNLPSIHYTSYNLFVADLTGETLNLPDSLLFFSGLGNIFLLWLIGRRIFSGNFSFIPPAIYGISFWNNYLVVAGSFYIFLLFIVLIVTYGLTLINSNRKTLGLLLLISGFITALYSSIMLFLVFFLIFIAAVILKIIPFRSLKLTIIFLTFSVLSLFFLIFVNIQGFKKILNKEVSIFSDPGIINMVNKYQGLARQSDLGQFAKISENKYVFYTEFIILKSIKQFTPSTIFTPNEKLLGFSLSPPILLGFLIPFVYGVFKILKYKKWQKGFLLPGLLVIPSVLDKDIVNLNRLVIFSPFIILLSSYGLSILYKQRKQKIEFIFLAITLFLVAFQLLITLSDIGSREKFRFQKYFGQNFELKQ